MTEVVIYKPKYNDQFGGKKSLHNKQQNTFDYVIYHKNCIDGFAGFFLLTQTNLITNNATILGDVPHTNTLPKNINGKNVIIIDVAYKYHILKQIFKKSKSVTFIDHHITINQDVKKLKLRIHDKIVYDEQESGVSLVWKTFYPNKKLPKFVKYIKDNDIGQWIYPETLPFITALSVQYLLEPTKSNLTKWNNLLTNSEVTKLIDIGKVYNEYKDHLVNLYSKRYTVEKFPSKLLCNDYPDYFKEPGIYKVAVICGNPCPTIASITMKILKESSCDFIIFWNYHINDNKYVLTFRSTKVDVGSICKLFGNGGGHKFAAACNFNRSQYNIWDLFIAK